jgi:cyclic pyranopterin phosphate synthase
MNDKRELTHLTPGGDLTMVDVGDKEPTTRTARAEAVVRMETATAKALSERKLKKGDAYAVAKIAGIQAAKETARLIPLCHNLHIEKVDVTLDEPMPDKGLADKSTVRIESFVRVHAKTGVEMEALVAVSVAALTLYDMCKAMDKGIEVVSIKLLEKTGGRSDLK